MHVQVHYQNLDNTQWTDQFVQDRVNRLNKYLSPSSSVQVNLRFENRSYVTSLAIHSFHHDYAFMSEGLNFFESLAEAIDKASRVLGEQKRRMKDKINKQFYSLKYEGVP